VWIFEGGTFYSTKEEHWITEKVENATTETESENQKYNISQLVIEYHGVNFVENCVDSAGRWESADAGGAAWHEALGCDS